MVDFKNLNPKPVPEPVATAEDALRVTREFLRHDRPEFHPLNPPTETATTATMTPAWNERGWQWRADFGVNAPAAGRLTPLTTTPQPGLLFSARQKIRALSEVNNHLGYAIANYEEALQYWPEIVRPDIRERYIRPLEVVRDANAEEIAYLENPIGPEEGQAPGVDLQGVYRTAGDHPVLQPGEAR